MWMCWPSNIGERTCYQVSVWILVLSSQDRKEGRMGVERWGGQIGSGFRSGHLVVTRVFPMSGLTWELPWCVAYIPIFTAAKAVEQSAWLWPGHRAVRLPVALISNRSLPFMQDGKAGDPSALAQSVAWPREAWIAGQRHSLAHYLDAHKGSGNKTSILGHVKIKTGALVCNGNVGKQFSILFMYYIYLF